MITLFCSITHILRLPYPNLSKTQYVFYFLKPKINAMKNLIFIVVVSVVYSACTGTTTASNESSSSSASTNASAISYPYTAGYSSKISIGKDSNALLVLNSYKAWETGDMTALGNTFGDSRI